LFIEQFSTKPALCHSAILPFRHLAKFRTEWQVAESENLVFYQILILIT